MSFLQQVVAIVGFAWLAALAALVLLGLLSGSINTDGLLSRKNPSDPGLSPMRVQLLITTIAAAGTYVAKVLVTKDLGRLPEFDPAWLGVAGASNVAYIVGKVSRLFRDPTTSRVN